MLALLVGVMMIVVVGIGMLVFVTDAVFLLSAAIVDGVEQVAFDEEHQGAEEGASVHGGQDAFEIGEGKGKVEGHDLFPDHDTHGSRPYFVLFEEVFDEFVRDSRFHTISI